MGVLLPMPIVSDHFRHLPRADLISNCPKLRPVRKYAFLESILLLFTPLFVSITSLVLLPL